MRESKDIGCSQSDGLNDINVSTSEGNAETNWFFGQDIENENI